jgi:5-methylcytosine-specific restriction endonuclease McrA
MRWDPGGFGNPEEDGQDAGMPDRHEKQCPKCRKSRPRADFLTGPPGEPPSIFCRSCRETTKTCRKCAEEKSITEFASKRGDRYGFCKPCYSEIRARMYEATRARLDKHFGVDRPKHAYADEDPDEVLKRPKRRRAERLKAALKAPINREEIFARDEWRCWICGEPVLREHASIDHLVPIARGGSDQPDNVRLAHSLCNSRRGARMPSG